MLNFRSLALAPQMTHIEHYSYQKIISIVSLWICTKIPLSQCTVSELLAKVASWASKHHSEVHTFISEETRGKKVLKSVSSLLKDKGMILSHLVQEFPSDNSQRRQGNISFFLPTIYCGNIDITSCILWCIIHLLTFDRPHWHSSC